MEHFIPPLDLNHYFDSFTIATMT